MTLSHSMPEGPFDVCIVGSGPAGVILALEIERLSPERRVMIVEFGTDGAGVRNWLDDRISITNPTHHHDPYECTNKGLGGSSASWGGRCVMYDEVDFKPRAPFASECTWPDGIWKELNPYVSPLQKYFDCAPGGYNLREIPGIEYRPIAAGFKEGDVLDSVVEKWSMPTRFGIHYRARLEKSSSISVVLGWCVSRLEPGADGRVQRITVRNSAGVEAVVSAKTFVLAAGAQESTRILLRSPQLFARRSAPPAALGRYYQGHISGKIASVQFSGDPKATDFGFQRSSGGEYVRRRFQFPTDVLVRDGIFNTALWLDNPLYVDPSHRSGAMSFMYLAMITPGLGKRLAPPAVAHSITKGKVNAIGAHLMNILRDLPSSLWIPASIFFRRYCLRRKLPGVFLYSRSNLYALHFHAEQEPKTENRMELAADGETLVMHYGYTDEDVKSVLKAHAKLDHWLQRCGCGRLKYWYLPEELPRQIREGSKDGVHQVGTTRMSSKPDDGVVDANLALWDAPNVYVCSSSVFPTSGQANPTFLLGVFAARLANHLCSCALR